MLVKIDKESTRRLLKEGINPRLTQGTLLEDDVQKIDVEDQKQRETMMQQHHEMGHFGGTALARAILQAGYHWASLYSDCAKHVSQCSQCRRFTISKKGYHPYTPILASLPMDHISFDLFQLKTTREGYNYGLVVVDVATRYVFLRPLQTKEATAVASALFLLFTDVGFPRILQSDNGKEFVNGTLH